MRLVPLRRSCRTCADELALPSQILIDVTFAALLHFCSFEINDDGFYNRNQVIWGFLAGK
jgi:hypothetical protein